MSTHSQTFRFADVAVTPTAPEFNGIYRNKPQHPPDFSAVLDRASQANVKHVLLTCMSLRDVDTILQICRSKPDIAVMTVGVHPYHAQEPWDEAPNYFGVLRTRIIELIAEGKGGPLKAFGELGLDFDRVEKVSKEIQIRTFRAQLEMIVQEGWDLPLFLHCRNACVEFIEITREFVGKLPRGGLVHSFVGSKEEMQQLVDLGLQIGINGFSFANEESLEMVRAVPLVSLQIETDAPWGWINPNGELAKKFPVPQGGVTFQSKKKDKFEMGLMVKERNESCLIAQVAAIVAGVKGVGIEEVVEAAWRNSTSMFRVEE